MSSPEVGDAYVSSQIQNPDSRWASRITCIEVQERGFRFRREHPSHNGETFLLNQQGLETSSWIPSNLPIDYAI